MAETENISVIFSQYKTAIICEALGRKRRCDLMNQLFKWELSISVQRFSY